MSTGARSRKVYTLAGRQSAEEFESPSTENTLIDPARLTGVHPNSVSVQRNEALTTSVFGTSTSKQPPSLKQSLLVTTRKGELRDFHGLGPDVETASGYKLRDKAVLSFRVPQTRPKSSSAWSLECPTKNGQMRLGFGQRNSSPSPRTSVLSAKENLNGPSSPVANVHGTEATTLSKRRSPCECEDSAPIFADSPTRRLYTVGTAQNNNHAGRVWPAPASMTFNLPNPSKGPSPRKYLCPTGEDRDATIKQFRSKHTILPPDTPRSDEQVSSSDEDESRTQLKEARALLVRDKSSTQHRRAKKRGTRTPLKVDDTLPMPAFRIQKQRREVSEEIEEASADRAVSDEESFIFSPSKKVKSSHAALESETEDNAHHSAFMRSIQRAKIRKGKHRVHQWIVLIVQRHSRNISCRLSG